MPLTQEMNEPSRAPLRVLQASLAAMVLWAPLVQGGTPRLGVFGLELLFAVALLAAAAGGAIPRLPSAPEAALYLLVALASLNLPLVAYYHDAERCFLLILTYAGAFSLMTRLPGARGLAPVLGAVKVSAAFQAAWALGQALRIGRYQPQGTFDNPNFLAGFLAAAAGIFLAGALGLARRDGGAAPALGRWADPAGFLLVSAGVLQTRSRGGVLAFVAILGAVLALRFGRKALAVVTALLAALLLVPNPLRDRLAGLSLRDAWAWSRLEMWRSALEMFADHPLAGVGLGQYQFNSPRYAFPVEGYWARYLKVADNPHSEYLMLAAELGLAGLLVLAFFLWALVRSGLAARRSGKGFPWPLAVLAGTAVQAGVDFSLHSPPVVLVSLTLLAAAQGPPPARSAARPPSRSLRWLILAGLPVYLLLAARPFCGFYYFLRAGGGGAADLLNEKAAMARWGAGKAPDFEEMERAIGCDGGSAPYHSAAGSLALKRWAAGEGRRWLDLAVAEIETAAALNPDNFTYFGHLADLHLSLYRRGETGRDHLSLSLRHLRRAVHLAPFNTFLRDRFGQQLMASGRPLEAAEQFERAVELEPCYLRGRFDLGQSLEELGQAEEAVRAYRDLLERAGECRKARPVGEYETGLIDLDLSLVHNRLATLVRRGMAPEGPPRHEDSVDGAPLESPVR